MIQAETGPKGETEDDLKLSQARAMVVRQYLADKFKIDDARVKTMGLGKDQKAQPDSAGRVTILVYPGSSERSAVQAKSR